MDKKLTYVYPRVGLTGLCNMFYPWARAVVWARDNDARDIAPDWVQFGRWGVWRRWERDKRTYLGQFTNDGYITGFKKWWLMHTSDIIKEEDVYSQNPCIYTGRVIEFLGREEWGWMEPIKYEADFLRNELERIVNPRIVANLARLPQKFIAVHIRRGDFHYGDELQPDSYYLAAIARAVHDVGERMPILVFSDATSAELSFLGKKDNVVVMPKAPAVHDVLALSRASAIVGTNHSTFSYWGAFLSCGRPSYWSSIGHRTTLPEDICPVTYIER